MLIKNFCKQPCQPTPYRISMPVSFLEDLIRSFPMIPSSRINNQLRQLVNAKIVYKISCTRKIQLFKFCNLYLKKYIQVCKYKYSIFFIFSLLFTGYILHLDSFHFSDLACFSDNVKGSLLQFQIQLKKSGRSDIYSLPIFLGFPLRK